MQHKKKSNRSYKDLFLCVCVLLLWHQLLRNAHHSNQSRPEGLDIIITTGAKNKSAAFYSTVCPSLSFTCDREDIDSTRADTCSKPDS